MVGEIVVSVCDSENCRLTTVESSEVGKMTLKVTWGHRKWRCSMSRNL